MCSLFYACDSVSVFRLLALLAGAVTVIVALIAIAVIGYAEAKAKRTGIDADQIDRIINDARNRARRQGYDDA